ncbi:MAG: hypothetical protein H7123_09905 [Thermoleophilia bacterium]|nr:hypothetical protein [Thermoleophilia bacterium]
MGANITTLGDTLVTAFALGNPVGVHVVIAELVGIMSITTLLLAFFYTPLTELVVRVTDSILRSRVRPGSFVAALFCIPIVLIWALSSALVAGHMALLRGELPDAKSGSCDSSGAGRDAHAS